MAHEGMIRDNKERLHSKIMWAKGKLWSSVHSPGEPLFCTSVKTDSYMAVRWLSHQLCIPWQGGETVMIEARGGSKFTALTRQADVRFEMRLPTSEQQTSPPPHL